MKLDSLHNVILDLHSWLYIYTTLAAWLYISKDVPYVGCIMADIIVCS